MRHALALVLLATPLAAAEPATLARRIDAIVDRPAFASALWGVEVRSLASGKLLYARNAERALKPASVFKLITTAAALDAFGPDERLHTTLETAGRVDSLGRVLGDVYLIGRGDPSLSGRFEDPGFQSRFDAHPKAAFEAMADALWAQGVRRIEGRLIGHEGLFSGDRRGADWSWEDLVWSYGAEVSALAFGDNTMTLRVAPGERVGDPVVVDRVPASTYAIVTSTATTAAQGGKSELSLSRAPGGNRIVLAGTLPAGAAPEELTVALEDPARYATTVLAEVLSAKGIAVTGSIVTSSEALPNGLRVLAAHDSPPMADLIKAVNKPSQNLYAEMLLRLLGVHTKGQGTAEAGHEAIVAFLNRVGVAPDRFVLQDGSGLSRSDLVTAHDLVALLVAMHKHRYAAPYRDSLPLAGVDGTLRGRMQGTPAERHVRAKTGSLRFVSTMAGYADGPGGGVAFAILVNNNQAPAVGAIDEIAALLAGR
jgi:D-alanyl-D-alanine carboxypeptidase/D-alanyl-D-alanine-endopeptidase (penicillin-binding protein 4)